MAAIPCRASHHVAWARPDQSADVGRSGHRSVTWRPCWSSGITLVPILYVVVGRFPDLGPDKHLTGSLAAPVGPQQLPADPRVQLVLAVRGQQPLHRGRGHNRLAVGLGSLAAFALARYSFKGREAFFGLFMVGLLFPAGVASLPLYLLLRKIGLLENLMGVAIPEAAFSLPYTIFILAAVPAGRTR